MAVIPFRKIRYDPINGWGEFPESHLRASCCCACGIFACSLRKPIGATRALTILRRSHLRNHLKEPYD